MRKLLLVSAVSALSFAFGSSVRGDVISCTLDEGNSTLTGTSTGPYGTVTIDLTSSTTATITFTADPGFLFLSNGAVAFEPNASAFSGTFSATVLPGFSGPSLTFDPNQNEDGFGSFAVTFDEFDGFQYALSSFTTDITNQSGTWADASDVLTPNGGGNVVAAHIGICNTNPCEDAASGGSFLATGYATSGPTQAPEPSSLSMLGIGVLGLLGFARRHLLAEPVKHTYSFKRFW
jgi:hypothetical protein